LLALLVLLFVYSVTVIKVLFAAARNDTSQNLFSGFKRKPTEISVILRQNNVPRYQKESRINGRNSNTDGRNHVSETALLKQK
jgi:hypothetical protein